MNTNVAPYALGPGDGEAFWGFGSLGTVKASAEQTGGRFSMIEEISPKGASTPLHHHPDDEAFYVLEGEMTFYLEDDQPVAAPAGSFVHVPGGAVHAFRVDSETARYIIITTARHESFYRAAFGDPAGSRDLPPKSELDWGRINAAAEKFEVEVVGPPPDDPA